MSTTTTSRTATAGLVGGALWALFPVAWSAASLESQQFGTLAFIAVAAAYWLFAVLPPALLVAGHRALRAALGATAGRVGSIGIALASLGLGAMAVGNGIEVASLSAGGDEVAAGHFTFLAGFLVSVVGALLVGITVIRQRRDGLSRAAGWLLALALPLGLGIGFLGSTLDPANDAWFWATITVPTGIAWVLLGRALQPLRRRSRDLVTAS